MINLDNQSEWHITLENLLGHHEGGDRQYRYDDGKGNPTFGRGLLLDDAAKKQLPNKIKKDIIDGKAPIPQKIRDKIFKDRLKESERMATHFAGGTRNFNKLSETRRIVLTSMAYQLGGKNILKFEKFQTYLKAMIKAKGTYLEQRFRNEAMGEMADSRWFREDKTNRATDLIGSFISDKIFIEGEFRSPEEILKLSIGKQKIADAEDAKQERLNSLPPLDFQKTAERFNKTDEKTESSRYAKEIAVKAPKPIYSGTKVRKKNFGGMAGAEPLIQKESGSI